MYLARFSYDVLPANRQRAIDFIRGDAASPKPELYALLKAEGDRLRHPPADQCGRAGAALVRDYRAAVRELALP